MAVESAKRALSPDTEKFLQELEEEAALRFSSNDEEYQLHCTKINNPPVVVFESFERDRDRDRRADFGRKRDYDGFNKDSNRPQRRDDYQRNNYKRRHYDQGGDRDGDNRDDFRQRDGKRRYDYKEHTRQQRSSPTRRYE